MDIVQPAFDHLAGIDYAIVILYMVGVFFLGTFFGKYVKNAGDYFVASRSLPFWAIGMSIVVSDIGAMDFVAVAGGAYTDGIAVANFDWIGSMPAMVFAAFVFVPYFWRSGVYTIPEWLGRRYNAAVQIIHAGIWGVFLLVMLSLMLWATGDKLMHTILGWDPITTVWIMAGITGVYTFAGGLSAVVMVDVVQLIIMFVGGLSLLFLSMWEVGGPVTLDHKILANDPRVVITLNVNEPVASASVEQSLTGAGYQVLKINPGKPNQFVAVLGPVGTREVDRVDLAQTRTQILDKMEAALAPHTGDDPSKVDLQLRTYENHLNILLPHNTDKPYPWTGIVFGLGIVLAVAYMSGNQVIVQRTLGARTEWDAKGGMLFGGFLKSFIPLMVAVPGLCAVVIAPDLADGDKAVPEMIKMLMPPGLKGLMFVALFAALMSSVDSTLNSASTIWTTDILGRLREIATGKKLTGRQALIMGRVFTFAFIVTAALMAKTVGKYEGLYVFIQTALSFFQGPVLAILLLGIVWKRANQWGGLAGLVFGVGFTFVLNCIDNLFPSDDPFLFVAWWSFVFSLIVTIVVSLLTKPEPEEKIRGLVWGQVMHDGEIQRVLTSRVHD
jgi:Na+/proline symporter